MARPKVRDDLALMEGYHSPQVSVEVRLNTNEAPEPPPAAFTEALAAAVRQVEWHRYPDRSADALRARLAQVEGDAVPGGLTAANVLAANGSNEVLQTVLLTFGGPGRTALVAESRRARRERAHAAERRSAHVDGSDGERRAEDDEADLDRVLSQLDDDERELLRLRVVQGWSIPAIARWIAMEPRRVESRVRRVLARLRERGRA